MEWAHLWNTLPNSKLPSSSHTETLPTFNKLPANLLAYHASTIAEFLNNIRYAIRLYVTPVAKTHYRATGNIDGIEIYTFERPADIVNKFAWAQYFDLLQGSLRKPNFPPFSVTPSMKMRF